ncbi:MAG: histidinol-phosphate transaminase [Candidatus Coatesbacteria bacterium]|nr:histidinol-phosphate transaminase [Candidatus Coatesbacteria bacterium]
MKASKFENKHLESIPVYIPGKPISEVRRELGIEGDFIKLASNESPYGCSDKAKEAAASAINESWLYPDGTSFYLRKSIADFYGLPFENVIVGSGSVELIDLLAFAFLNKDTELLTSDKTFLMAQIAAKKVNALENIVPTTPGYAYDVDEIISRISSRTRILYIANPNNPTGTFINNEGIKKIMNAVDDNLIVVFDEAYYEYAEDQIDTLRYLRENRQVMILRTFSKAYGLAGMRVGYGLCHPELVVSLDKIRNPFNLTIIAQEAALAALKDQEHIKKVIYLNKAERIFMEESLKKLGLKYVPSVTNFLLVEFTTDTKKVYNDLLKKGIIVRPVANYGLPNHLRISLGTRKQNELLLKALENII